MALTKLATDLIDGSLGTDKISNDAITTDKIVNSAVATDKIANSAVNSTKVDSSVIKTVTLTQAAYDALGTYDSSTIYITTV